MSDMNIPVYVTRANNDGTRGTWSINAYWGVGILYLAVTNAVGWGIYGIVQAAIHLVGLL